MSPDTSINPVTATANDVAIIGPGPMSGKTNYFAEARMALENQKAAPEVTEEEKVKFSEKMEAMSEYLLGVRKALTRHNTPFDGRIRNKLVAKRKRSRRANKNRKLYLRYGT